MREKMNRYGRFFSLIAEKLGFFIYKKRNMLHLPQKNILHNYSLANTIFIEYIEVQFKLKLKIKSFGNSESQISFAVV